MVRKAAKRAKPADPTAAIARTPPRTTRPKPPDATGTGPETGPESTQTPEGELAAHPEGSASSGTSEGDTGPDGNSESNAVPMSNAQTHIDQLIDQGRLVPGKAATGPIAPPTLRFPGSKNVQLDKRTIARLRTRLRGDAGRYARACEDMQLARQEWEQTAADALEQGCALPLIQSAAYEAGLTDADMPDWGYDR